MFAQEFQCDVTVLVIRTNTFQCRVKIVVYASAALSTMKNPLQEHRVVTGNMQSQFWFPTECLLRYRCARLALSSLKRRYSKIKRLTTKSSAFSRDLGKPSNKIRFPGWSFIRFCIKATINAELTKPPLFIMASTCFPSGVPLATSSLSKSPDDK